MKGDRPMTKHSKSLPKAKPATATKMAKPATTSETQLRITKAGDPYLRRLLVGSAQYIVGPVRTRFRSTPTWRKANAARWQERQEARHRRSRPQSCRALTPTVDHGRGLRAPTQLESSGVNESRISWTDEFFALVPVPKRVGSSRSPVTSHGDQPPIVATTLQ